MGLSFGELESLICLALQSCLSIKLLGTLLRKGDGLLRIVPGMQVQISLIVCTISVIVLAPR